VSHFCLEMSVLIIDLNSLNIYGPNCDDQCDWEYEFNHVLLSVSCKRFN